MTQQLEQMKLVELRLLGKELGIKSVTTLRKHALIEAIQQAQNSTGDRD